MGPLWRKAPATARDVHEALRTETGWAYTTVRTLLTRLVGKGAVAERKEGRSSLYEPLLDIGAARRSALRALAERAFDGAMGPMMHFLIADAKLTPRDRARLESMLRRSRS